MNLGSVCAFIPGFLAQVVLLREHLSRLFSLLRSSPCHEPTLGAALRTWYHLQFGAIVNKAVMSILVPLGETSPLIAGNSWAGR